MNKMIIKLSSDDLKIVSLAISWTLYTPFDRSDPPVFTDIERNRLQAIFDQICQYRQDYNDDVDAAITVNDLIIQGKTITANGFEVQQVIWCIQSFCNEIGHSPTEVSAVTGMPISQLQSLLGRLLLLH
jgi:hypothetical protein